MLPVFDGLRNITLASVAFRLILSTLCGGIVGMERGVSNPYPDLPWRSYDHTDK